MGSLAGSVGSRGIDTNGGPAEQTVGDVVTEEDIVENGIGTSGDSSIGKDAVVNVLNNGVGVLAVRRELIHLGDEGLVEEELAGVGNGSSSKSAVAELSSANVSNNVDVSSTAAIVPGENGVETCDTVGVGLLDTAKGSVIKVGPVCGVAVAIANDAAVDTGGVAAEMKGY